MAKKIILSALILYGLLHLGAYSEPFFQPGKRTKNKVVGTWKLQTGYIERNGKRMDLLGKHPSGQLIFTNDGRFNVVVNNPDIPRFASEDRAKGTAEEMKTAVVNSLGLYGTYTVDVKGDFLAQHIIGSTFPNWNNLDRGRDEITEIVEGDRMLEHLKVAGGATVVIEWHRVK